MRQILNPNLNSSTWVNRRIDSGYICDSCGHWCHWSTIKSILLSAVLFDWGDDQRPSNGIRWRQHGWFESRINATAHSRAHHHEKALILRHDWNSSEENKGSDCYIEIRDVKYRHRGDQGTKPRTKGRIEGRVKRWEDEIWRRTQDLDSRGRTEDETQSSRASITCVARW
jgi:hypothetical protein